MVSIDDDFEVGGGGLHCNDVGLTSPLGFLVLCTPGTHGIAQVGAFEVDLGVIAHVVFSSSTSR